jgi:O-antigen chain-terminating methyltransferase
MIKFTAEVRGLSKVTIMKLNSYAEDQKLNGFPMVERLNNFFYGSQDYAVIGYKNG